MKTLPPKKQIVKAVLLASLWLFLIVGGNLPLLKVALILALALCVVVLRNRHTMVKHLTEERDHWKEVAASGIDTRILDAWMSGKIEIRRAFRLSCNSGKDHTYWVTLPGESVGDPQVHDRPLREAFQEAVVRSEQRIEKLYEEASKLSTITM